MNSTYLNRGVISKKFPQFGQVKAPLKQENSKEMRKEEKNEHKTEKEVAPEETK